MEDFEEVAPSTLPVRLTESGIVVEYTDGREVYYRGVPDRVDPPHQTAPGKDIHVLVTDESESSGVLLYVNERRTDAGILEDTGVGRVLLDEGEETTLFPGVVVRRRSLRCEIDIDDPAEAGRVFVFEEDQFEERSYEISPPETAAENH